jgi:hypothetical protein
LGSIFDLDVMRILDWDFGLGFWIGEAGTFCGCWRAVELMIYVRDF